MKPKVYYSKDDFSKLLEHLPKDLKGKTGIKVHFGEKGCTTFINPKHVEKVSVQLKSNTDVSLIECNVLYKGSRTDRATHIATAKEHGFDFAPIDICDGETGADFLEIPIDGKHFKSIFVGKNLENYDNLVVISHFKGHMATGFGGTLKNIGMGLGSRKGKMAMHKAFDLIINKDICQGCGVCADKCDANAIEVIEGTAKIDFDKCMHCAGCIANCPQGAINIPWGSDSSENLQEKIAEYCLGISNKLNCASFINVLENITPGCDCMGHAQKPMTPDLGFLISNDPVALDQASYDLLEKAMGKEIFSSQRVKDSTHQLKYAEEISLGNRDYELIEK